MTTENNIGTERERMVHKKNEALNISGGLIVESHYSICTELEACYHSPN